MKADFRLATFQDALAQQAETLIKSIQETKEESKCESVTSPESNKCELCDENVIDSFCRQCQQWICAHCRKTHSKARATKRHTYVVFTEHLQWMKKSLSSEVDALKQKIDNANSLTRGYDKIVGEIAETRYNAKTRSDQLRKFVLNDVNEFFDKFDARTTSFCDTCTAMCLEEKQEFEAKITKAKAIARDATDVTEQDDLVFLTRGEKLLFDVSACARAYDEQLRRALVVPEVTLGRRNNWSVGSGLQSKHSSAKRRVRVSTAATSDAFR